MAPHFMVYKHIQTKTRPNQVDYTPVPFRGNTSRLAQLDEQYTTVRMSVLFGSIMEHCMVNMIYGLGSSPRLTHGGSNKGPVNLDFSALCRGTSWKLYQNHRTSARILFI